MNFSSQSEIFHIGPQGDAYLYGVSTRVRWRGHVCKKGKIKGVEIED